MDWTPGYEFHDGDRLAVTVMRRRTLLDHLLRRTRSYQGVFEVEPSGTITLDHAPARGDTVSVVYEPDWPETHET